MAMGVQRFHILSQHREKPYLCGLVEIYEDIAEPEQTLIVYADQARELFNSYLEILLEVVGKHGVILGIEVRSLDPPAVQGTLIFPQAGKPSGPFQALIRTAAVRVLAAA